MTSLVINSYQRRYHQAVRDLMFRSHHVHSHLDWQETEDWLDTQPALVRLAWDAGSLVGVLGVSRPLNNACWVRLAVVDDRTDQQAILCALWENLVADLRGQHITSVALLGIRDWILPLLPELGFAYVEDIITMARGGDLLPELPPNSLVIRPALTSDMDIVAQVDQAAFNPPWQLAADELRQALRIASSCTVALLEGQIVGYQLSTLYFDGAHLARLAVKPGLQGAGVGGALLSNVLQRFFRRGVYLMTVNTQSSNHRSRRLYTHYGFQANGYDLPLWSASLSRLSGNNA